MLRHGALVGSGEACDAHVVRTRIAALLVTATSVGTLVGACGSDERARIMFVSGAPESPRLDVAVGLCGAAGLVIGVVAETPQSVLLRVRADDDGNGEECAMSQTVHLAEPLGSRSVFDADSGDEIEVRA
ncbi:unannotated protein [freshwater metagenome]|uniref:Unannotated protein n=1 Tax=freshwater metagenome TaxID=449393 RepID=A0A6J6FEL2_9ZZZZ